MSGRKIDINKAGIDDLSSLIGVGRAKAEAILDARKAKNGFKTVSDLKDVPGIGPSILEQNHGMLSCSRATSKGKQERDGSLSGPHSSSDTYCLRRDRSGDVPLSSTSETTTYSLRDRSSEAGPSCSENMTYSLRDRGGSSGDSNNANKARHSNLSNNKTTVANNSLPGASAFKEYRASAGDAVGDTSDEGGLEEEGDGNSSDSQEDPSAYNEIEDEIVDSEIEFKGRPNRQFELLSESESNSSHELEQNNEAAEHMAASDGVDKRLSKGTDDGLSTQHNDNDGNDQEDEDTTIGVVASLRSRSSLSALDKSVMKRKSEGGGSKDGSPEKKPCRTSGETAVPSTQSQENTSAAISTRGNVSKSTEKSLHSLLRKGRIPSKAHPPPELANWLKTFQEWSHPERLMALDELMELCEPTQVRHVMAVIEPQFQRDFISLLPKELALYVLTYLEPKDLCRAAQTCRYWRILAEDNLLWREKCKEESIDENLVYENRTRKRSGGNNKSPWKTMYMRQKQIEFNWRQGDIRSPKVLKGHDDHVITCLEFSGTKIVSGSDDNTLKVWSAVTGKCLRTLVGHTGGVWSSQMRENIIISGSTDRTLKVWNADTGQCVHTLYGHTSTVRCMCLYENKVVSGSRDATLRLWDVDTGQCLHVLMGHVAAVRCVQFDGRRVVSGAYDYMVKVWDPETESCLHTLQGHTNRVYSLQFDGNHIVSGSLDTSIRVWDVETGQCLHTLIGHQSLTSGMELKDNILVSGNADSTVKVWDIKTGQCLQTLQGPNKHQSAVTCLQFSKKFVITSSDDGTVKVWSLKTGDFLRNLVALASGGSGGVVWRIRCSNTKLVCAVGSRNGTEETKLLVLDFDAESDISNSTIICSPMHSLTSSLGRRASITSS